MPDLSFFAPLVLQSAVIPFGVAFALLAISRALRLGPAAAALAIAAGFIAGYFAILHTQWSAWPKVALDWLPWIAVGAAAGALAIERIGNAGVRLTARFGLALAAAGLVVWPALASLGVQQAVLAAGVTAALVCAVWSYLARAAVIRPTPPLLLAISAGGAALALMLHSSQSLGQLSGALASVLVARLAFNLPRVRIPLSAAAAGVVSLLLGALLVNAYLYAEFPLGYIALLVGSLIADPLVAGLNNLRQRSSGAAAWIAAAALAAIPTAVTIGLAAKAASEAGGY